MVLVDKRSPSAIVRNRYLTNGGVATALIAAILSKIAYVRDNLLALF